MIRIRQGLNLPIAGAPEQTIEAAPPVKRIALLGDDHFGMKPTLLVKVGDSVKLGQPVFTDKKTPGVTYTSPGCGKVASVNRGAKRHFESLVIELDGDDEETFDSYTPAELGDLDREKAHANLLASGLWTALRTRPFSNVPVPSSVPHAIFVAAMDTRPLAADPLPIIKARQSDFVSGVRVLKLLTDGTVHVCTTPNADISIGNPGQVRIAEFDGPHPAGLPGTHIHFIEPVSDKKTVWTINYQDVMAIGRLFTTGKLDVERVIALGGPVVDRPRLLRTRLGASIEDITAGSVPTEGVRLISGSVLDGHTAEGNSAFLGCYHLQVSAISDSVGRPFLGWLSPGSDKFSVTRAFTSAITGFGKKFAFSTAAFGDTRPIIPIGVFEKVMPLDFEPVALLKSLAIGDTEVAQALGCMELDEEDLSLCSFVDPGKSAFGTYLRNVLTNIEREG